MEAQSLISGLCSNSTIPPIQNPYKIFYSTLPSSSSSPSSSQILPPKRVSFKTRYSLSSKIASSKNKLQCRNSFRKAEAVTGDGEDLKTGVRRKNLAVFVSGGGSNFRSIHEAILRGSVHGDIVVLVTNKPGCGGAEYARDKDIPVILFPKMKEEPESLSANDLVTTLWSAFGGKSYYGMKVHKAVIASGARYSGPTIHFVDEHYDTGRILAQSVVSVLASDTADELAARVLQKEHELYVEVAAALCEERIIWREDGVPLIRTKENPNDYS